MKAILLVAVVGFVLAVGFAVPYGDDDLGAQENELKDIADELGDDLEREDLEGMMPAVRGKTAALIRKEFELVIDACLNLG